MRKGKSSRGTSETRVKVTVDIDGRGACEAATGVGFFDHMLDQIARHGLLDLTVAAEGDTHIDDHHVVEDTGIVMGAALREAIGDTAGICRFASEQVAMDEALSQAAVDVSGRPCLVWRCAFPTDRVGQFDVELVREFFQALAVNAGITLHVETLYGENTHHMVESCFKAAGRALRRALEADPRAEGRIPSTKGTLTPAS